MNAVRGFVTLSVVALMAPAVPRADSQDVFGDTAAIVQFQRAVDAYSFQHRQIQRRLGETVDAATMAAALHAARPSARDGDFFTPLVATAFRHRIAVGLKAPGCRIGPEGAGSEVPRVGALAIGTQPVAGCLMNLLPRLPEELEYRTASVALIILDTHARMVVDVLHGAFPMP